MNTAIRPESLNEFTGQKRALQIVSVLVKAALKRKEPVPHVLLSGPPGLGKTTLARIIANEMQSRRIEIVASHLQSPDELAIHLKGIRAGDVLFIDEIHGLPRAVEEVLYSAMEDFKIAVPQAGYDRLMKQLGMASTGSTMEMMILPKFTVVGATTLAGLVSDPLRSRFIQSLVLEPYTEDDLTTIVMNAAAKMKFPLVADVARIIAGRSRQTARIAIGHLRWIAEYCEALEKSPTVGILNEAFSLQGVDEEGLTALDRSYLMCLVEAGCPLGLSTLAASLGESRETLEQAVEPFLIRRGFLRRGPRGRVALPKAYDRVGREDAA